MSPHNKGGGKRWEIMGVGAFLATLFGGLGPFIAGVAINAVTSALLDPETLRDQRSALARAIDEAAAASGSPDDARIGLENWVRSPSWHDIRLRLERDPLAYRDAGLQAAFEQARDFANPLKARHAETARVFLEALSRHIANDRGHAGVVRMFAEGEARLDPLRTPLAVEASATSYADPRAERLRGALEAARTLIDDGYVDAASKKIEAVWTELTDGDPVRLYQDVARLRGNVLLMRDDPHGACQSWKDAYALDRDHAPAQLNRAYAAVIEAEWNAALEFLALALARAGHLTEQQRTAELGLRSEALLRLGRTDEVDALAGEYPDNPEITLARARLALQSGQSEGVRALLAPLLEASVARGEFRLAVIDAHAAMQILEALAHSTAFVDQGTVTARAAADPANARLERAAHDLASRQRHKLLAHVHSLRCNLFGRAHRYRGLSNNGTVDLHSMLSLPFSTFSNAPKPLYPVTRFNVSIQS